MTSIPKFKIINLCFLESYATLEKIDEMISSLFNFPVIRADLRRRELVTETGCKPCIKKKCKELHAFCVGFRYKRTGVLTADKVSKVCHYKHYCFFYLII